MRSIRVLLVSTLVFGFLAVNASAGNSRVEIIGEHLYGNVLESPHPYPGTSDSAARLVWADSYSYAEAAYLVFEFASFELAPGDYVLVRDPEGKQEHRYEGRGFLNKGGNFISKMILGSEAEVQLWSRNANPQSYGYRIERISRGFSAEELELLRNPEANCGTDDKKDAVCYETSFPDVYDEARAVARIVMDGSALCTAWLVSCDNHILTNNHCTWDDDDFNTQGELDRMEFQFMYQDATCGGGSPTVEYSFMGGTWLENNRNLDYTLIQAPVAENPAATYGWLNIDNRLVDLEEQIYIVGHPSGRPKEIGLESTDSSDASGFCEVYSQTEPPCIGGSVPEIGYMCDTEGGNSGSPVLSRITHKVVALHHCANCPNRGVRIQDIWNANQGGSNPLPPCSLFDDVGSVELDRNRHSCSDTISIEVNDGSLQGTGSTSVTIWSATESFAETVILSEIPADSGSFSGAITTTTAAAASGDSLLSVSNGDAVTVEYIDADDGQGGTDIPRHATSQIDCTAPVISGVATTNVTGMSADINWTTDKDATSLVTYDTVAPPTASNSSDSVLVTTHIVSLTALDECTPYFYQVTSADLAGNASADDNSGQYFTFTTGKNTIPTFDATGGPVAIPDNNPSGASWVINVPDDKIVLDVEVGLDITHSFDGDLRISLIGPDATQVILANRRGSSGDNYTGAIFDDEAPTPITNGTAPFTGAFIPEEALTAFDGKLATGQWTLFVEDLASIDTGSVTAWRLTLTFQAEICGPPGYLFGDGFEAGDTTAWSVTVQ